MTQIHTITTGKQPGHPGACVAHYDHFSLSHIPAHHFAHNPANHNSHHMIYASTHNPVNHIPYQLIQLQQQMAVYGPHYGINGSWF